MPIKTFRGLIKSGEVDTIPLHTNNVAMGYRIIKFEVISEFPGKQDTESTVTISKVPYTEPAYADWKGIDLSDQTILGVAFFGSPQIASAYPIQQVLLFDNEIFNQDIYIGTLDSQGNAMNYYIELEQVKLDLNENTVATLKDIRNLS